MIRALLIAVALLALAPASASALVIGIADQKPDMFTDERFQDLEIRHARIAVPWDVFESDWQTAELDRWMFLARVSGVQPLVTFSHSRVERRELPTPERLLHEFRRLRERYPWVDTFATWNEANHCGEPTCHRPGLVAAYWRKLRRECRDCIILAAELLDMPNMHRWARSFVRYAKREPERWGVHNYVEANRFRTRRLRRLLRTVDGQIWLTEVGGIVARRNKKRYTVRRIPESKWHALRVTRFVLREVAARAPRVTRVYVYHWNASSPQDTWDSALIDHRGRRRPAYVILRREIRRLEQRRERRARARRAKVRRANARARRAALQRRALAQRR